MNERYSATLGYRPDIDGLRALAVVPVCLFHANLQAFSGGFVGVSVFFVISGYLMATVIGRGLDGANFSLADFYERRIRRIFPALFVVLFLCSAAALVVVPPRSFQDFGANLNATLVFASNVVLWRKTANYFDTPSEWNPLLHTWSLAVEEQFYILFPFFLILIWRFRWRLRFALTALVAASSFLLSVWGTANAPTATFYLLPMRAWELLVGVIVGFGMMRDHRMNPRRERSHWPGGAGALLGLGLVVGSLLWYDREMAFPGVAALPPTVGAGLLVHFGRDQRGPVTRLLGLAPFAFIGRISYSLYLWHWPLLVFLDKYQPFGVLGPAYRAGVIVFSCLPAYLTRRWVEEPFLRRSTPIHRTAVYSAAAGAGAVLGTFGAFAQTSHGWPQRFPGLASVSIAPQLAREQRDPGWQEFSARGCFVSAATAWEKERCFLSRSARPNALLWGDSFANSYARGFFGNPRARFNILEYTSPRCPPIIGYEAASRPQCTEFNGQVASILERYDITTVVMAANWIAYLKRRKMRQYDVRNTVASLQRRGLRVVLVGQSPVFSFAYPDEYFFTTFGLRKIERESFATLDFDPDVNRRMAQISTASAFFDPLAVFCEKKQCAFRRGGKYLFIDWGHYTQYGSELAADALLDAINRTREPSDAR
jgi:peptidoglycan/LPS O-acetylase OafA/YrhL